VAGVAAPGVVDGLPPVSWLRSVFPFCRGAENQFLDGPCATHAGYGGKQHTLRSFDFLKRLAQQPPAEAKASLQQYHARKLAKPALPAAAAHFVWDPTDPDEGSADLQLQLQALVFGSAAAGQPHVRCWAYAHQLVWRRGGSCWVGLRSGGRGPGSGA
jgi:hypothetical protein